MDSKTLKTLEVTNGIRTELNTKSRDIVSEVVKSCKSLITGIQFEDSTSKSIKLFLENENQINEATDVS